LALATRFVVAFLLPPDLFPSRLALLTPEFAAVLVVVVEALEWELAVVLALPALVLTACGSSPHPVIVSTHNKQEMKTKKLRLVWCSVTIFRQTST
jgi:hypothetical protein